MRPSGLKKWNRSCKPWSQKAEKETFYWLTENLGPLCPNITTLWALRRQNFKPAPPRSLDLCVWWHRSCDDVLLGGTFTLHSADYPGGPDLGTQALQSREFLWLKAVVRDSQSRRRTSCGLAGLKMQGPHKEAEWPLEAESDPKGPPTRKVDLSPTTARNWIWSTAWKSFEVDFFL